MTGTTKTIAILFHERHCIRHTRRYVIAYLADHWRSDGHEVVFVFGTKRFIPADICIVHVDLSVVPVEYLEFASRYPLTLNGHLKDIRKTTYSKNIVEQRDQYDGMVIVKSNDNCAGLPEQLLLHSPLGSALSRIGRKLGLSPRFSSSRYYRIYERASDVPPVCFRDPYFIVEKFLPERASGLYCVNLQLFLGECHQCFKLSSDEPIVNGRSSVSSEVVEPHPEIIQLQRQMNVDYGKMDYCVSEGRVVLLDVNKTVGYGGLEHTDQLAALHRQRADGLYGYFE